MLDYEAWKSERFNGIGGTDMSAIVDKNPWKTKIDLYNEKISKVDIKPETRSMRRGKLLEHIVAQEYEDITGIKLTTKCPEFETNILLRHKKHPWLFANIDRFCPEHKAIAEIKTVTLNKYIDIKNNGLLDSWVIQIQHYLNITGFKKAVLIVFCQDKWEFLNEDENGIWIDRDDTLIEKMTEDAIHFWEHHIKNKIPPVENNFESTEMLNITKNDIFSQKVHKITSNEWEQLSFDLKETKTSLLIAKEKYDAAEITIKDFMDTNKITLASGGCIKTVSFKPVMPRTTWDIIGMQNELVANGVVDIDKRFKKVGSISKRFTVKFTN